MKKPCQIHLVHTRIFTPVDVFMNARTPSEEQDEWDPDPEEATFSSPLYRDSFAPMKKDIPSFSPAPTVLTTKGLFEPAKDGSFRISYQEGTEDGKGSVNTFCISPTGMLILMRRGTNNSCFVFENEKRHNCDYGLAGGLSSISLHTHKLQSDISEKGGFLFVDYSLELQGSLTERTTISLEVVPES